MTKIIGSVIILIIIVVLIIFFTAIMSNYKDPFNEFCESKGYNKSTDINTFYLDYRVDVECDKGKIYTHCFMDSNCIKNDKWGECIKYKSKLNCNW